MTDTPPERRNMPPAGGSEGVAVAQPSFALPDSFYNQLDHSIRPFYVKENIGQLIKAKQDNVPYVDVKPIFVGKIKIFLQDAIDETKNHEAQGRGGRSVAHVVYTIAEKLRNDTEISTADVVPAFDAPMYVAQTGEAYLMPVKDELSDTIQRATTVDEILEIFEGYLPPRTL